jgi:hypothetical protein
MESAKRWTPRLTTILGLRHGRHKRRGAMCNLRLLKRNLGFALATLCLFAISWSSMAVAADDVPYKLAGGLAVYIGVVPAEIVKGHPSGHTEKTMHGGAPRGAHQYHLVAAIFDAASRARVSDATVTAQISGIGLSGTKKKLDPMEIASTVTYGGFFNLPGRDLYTIGLTIDRPGQPKPVSLEFKYDHRR